MIADPQQSYKSVRESALWGFAYREWTDEGRWKLHILWKRLIPALLGVGILSYFVLMTALFFYLREVSNYKNASYWNTLFLPLRLEAFYQELGEYRIERGLAAIESKEFGKAFALLRSGLNRYPDHAEARQYLAQFYLPGRYPMALDILKVKLLDNLDNPEYLKLYFQILLQYNLDEQAIEEAARILPEIEDKKTRQSVAYFYALALAYRGQYDRSEDIIKEYDLSSKVDGYMLLANLAWERGQRETAIARLESGVRQFPGNALALYQRLTQYFLLNEQYDKARRYSILRSTYNPLAFGPRIDLLYVFSKSNEEERQEEELNEILEQHGDEPEAMSLLGNFATFDKNIPLAHKLYERARRAEDKDAWNVGGFAMDYLRTAIAAEDFTEATEFGEDLLEQRPAWLDDYRTELNGLLAVGYYGMNNRNFADVYLNELLKNRDENIALLLEIGQVLKSVNALQQARRVLLSAYEANPRNQQILSELLRIELEMGHSNRLRDYLEKLLQLRRPSRALLSDAYHKIASDRFIFARDRKQLLLELRSLLGEKSSG